MILDMVMPNMDGISLASILRSRDDTKDIPIIVLTVSDSKTMKKDCIDLGVDAYLHKPYHPKTLLKKVKELLER